MISNHSYQAHFKMKVDGFFSRVNFSIAQAEKSETIEDAEGLVDVLTRDYNARKELDPTIAEEVYVEWMPPKKSKIDSAKIILPDALPGIQSSYAWEARILNKARNVICKLSKPN